MARRTIACLVPTPGADLVVNRRACQVLSDGAAQSR